MGYHYYMIFYIIYNKRINISALRSLSMPAEADSAEVKAEKQSAKEAMREVTLKGRDRYQ